ncbi:hypothetical protein ACIBG8_51915 [Nonomuraea sp. NPDC050556]|uniref:hypothetical protein n=1 Tax=Nonomuraea sp. NPDC050556 TaxID=3364369 RepID=UPI003789F112
MHERVIPGTPDEVWAALAKTPDLWPEGHGSFRLPEGLFEGAPVNLIGKTCRIKTLEPGRKLWFDMGRAMPNGHGFTLTRVEGGTLLRHEVKGPLGPALKILWPLIIRKKHDTVLELLLDNIRHEVARTHTS